MESIWNQKLQKPRFDTLNGNITTDVLIVGGGIAGILCAYMLKQAGIDCIIAEASEICGGITQNTTAKITGQHGAIYDTMIQRFGVGTAKLYYEAQEKALQQYRDLCQTVDCDFEERDSFVYSIDDVEKIKREVAALKTIGCPAYFTKDVHLPFSVAGAVGVKKQAQFHPLKFAIALAKDLKILENTKVLEITPYGAITSSGKIKANKTIVTTHFPFINKYGGYFLKMYQHRSYVIAVKNAARAKGMYVDEAEKGMSFREYQDVLFVGGGGHRTGKPGGGWRELRSFIAANYPRAQEVAHWATQDCKTLDDIPYIGQYSKNTPHLFVATGFNKWGMTSAMTAAMLLTDLVQNKKNPFASVFSPSRSILRPQLLVNAFETTKNLLTPSVPRCPHLGCALKYNKQEHSWDCPCHGSRFAEDGKLLDNPATADKEM